MATLQRQNAFGLLSETTCFNWRNLLYINICSNDLRLNKTNCFTHIRHISADIYYCSPRDLSCTSVVPRQQCCFVDLSGNVPTSRHCRQVLKSQRSHGKCLTYNFITPTIQCGIRVRQMRHWSIQACICWILFSSECCILEYWNLPILLRISCCCLRCHQVSISTNDVNWGSRSLCLFV